MIYSCFDLSVYLQSLLPPDLQQQQPLQTVGHRLQRPLRKLLHRECPTIRHPCSLIQVDERKERPVGWQRGASELWEEVGSDPRAAPKESILGRENGRLQMGQVSEEAASYGRQLVAGFSQESTDRLERGRRLPLCVRVKFQLTELYSLGSSTVALS